MCVGLSIYQKRVSKLITQKTVFSVKFQQFFLSFFQGKLELFLTGINGHIKNRRDLEFVATFDTTGFPPYLLVKLP